MEQIARWKAAAISGNEPTGTLSKADAAVLRSARKNSRLLEKELRRKEEGAGRSRRAADSAKKSPSDLGRSRGRKLVTESCKTIIALVEEAVASGARQQSACEVLSLPERTLRRWKRRLATRQLTDQRKAAAALRGTSNALSEAEHTAIITTCNQPAFKSLPPSQIVPQLADQGTYLASESTFYRVLRDAKQQNRRGRADPPPRTVVKPKGYKATAPNQVWSWDITYLAASIRGSFYRLYLIEDIYSRKIVGWEIQDNETAEHASQLICKACLREGIHAEGLVLHSDNGGPMKGVTMLATLQKLGIVPSFSQPSVSDDNPYSESLFRTLKHCPIYLFHPVWIATTSNKPCRGKKLFNHKCQRRQPSISIG